jgi:hypothetical protein
MDRTIKVGYVGRHVYPSRGYYKESRHGVSMENAYYKTIPGEFSNEERQTA